MFYVQKRIEVAFAHQLNLSYPSKCQRVHGHNAIINIYCKSRELNNEGMVMDFTHIKKMVENKFDHQFLNDVIDFNPTAENIAYWICQQIPTCYKVSVQESEGNIAIYERENV